MASVEEAVSAKKWDGDGVPLAESNCAEIGSDADKAARKGAAATEPAWAGLGDAPCLKIFRIENFKVVPWPEKMYGSFFSGDSYILFHSYMHEDKLLHHIFFWLGEQTTTDEMGTAAYKTVELDDFLDGEPTQSREVQHHESAQFRALFRHIEYLEGGVESGFHHVGPDVYQPRLMRCRKTSQHGVRLKQVNLSRESMNHGDCFILDAGLVIYVWDGEESSPFEKAAANAAAEHIESSRDGKAKATHDIDGDFWGPLGGEGDIMPASAASDADSPEPTVGEGVLYRIDDGSGELRTAEVARGDVNEGMLDSGAVMMLDTDSEIFLWVGRGASPGENRNAMRTAMNFLQVNGKPLHTPMHMYKEGTPIKNATWCKIMSS